MTVRGPFSGLRGGGDGHNFSLTEVRCEFVDLETRLTLAVVGGIVQGW